MDYDSLPPQPLHLAFSRQMDFSPMHPDVWAETDAERWHYYIQIRQAFEDGRDEVKGEREGNREEERKKAERDRKTAEFQRKHTGASF